MAVGSGVQGPSTALIIIHCLGYPRALCSPFTLIKLTAQLKPVPVIKTISKLRQL